MHKVIKSISLEKTPKIIVNPEIHIEKPATKDENQEKINIEMEKASENFDALMHQYYKNIIPLQ